MPCSRRRNWLQRRPSATRKAAVRNRLGRARHRDGPPRLLRQDALQGLSELARTHSVDIAPADALIAYFEQHPTAFVPEELDMPWPQLAGSGGKGALTAQPGRVVERLARERDTAAGWRRPAIVPPRSRAPRQSGRPPRTSQYAVHQAARAAVLLFAPYLKDVASGQLVAEGQRHRARRRIRADANAPRRARGTKPAWAAAPGPVSRIAN